MVYVSQLKIYLAIFQQLEYMLVQVQGTKPRKTLVYVILYEIDEINQKPDVALSEVLHVVGYKNNTLGNPLLCPKERLSQITSDLIKEFMSTWYVPERIVVAAIGADHNEVVDLVYKYFG